MSAPGASVQTFFQEIHKQAKRLGLEVTHLDQRSMGYRYPGGQAILRLDDMWRQYNEAPAEERPAMTLWYLAEQVLRLKEPVFPVFIHKLMVEARIQGIEVTKVDDQSLEYRHDGAQGTLFFENMWKEYVRVQPEERGAFFAWWLEQHVTGMKDHLAVPDTFEAVRHRLLPRIVRGNWGQGTIAEGEFPLWPLVEGHLQISLVVDHPSTVTHVSESHMEQWGKSFEELYFEAEANLRRLTDPARVARVPGNVQVRSMQTGDSHDAARALLLKDLMRPWPPCGVVFVVPARDVLFFAPVVGHDTIGPLEDLVMNAAHIFAEAPRAISDQAFWFDGEAYEHIQVDLRPGGVGILPSDRFGWAINGRLVPAYPEG